MKRIICVMALSGISLAGFAQTDSITPLRILNEDNTKVKADYIPVTQYWKEHNIFQHLDLSLTAGTTGIGFDVASPVTEWAQVRAGYEFMPRFSKRMKFDLTIGGRPARIYDADGNRQETTFDRMSEFLYQFTGYDVDDHVDMIGKPTINNFKFLVDVFPFKQNRHWHFTAGFYWGPSQFAYAENAVESAVSLVSVGIYNRMYEKAVADEPLFDFESMGFDGMDYQPEYMDKIYKKIISFGRLGFAVGEFNGAFGVDKYGKYHQISADHYSYDEAGKIVFDEETMAAYNTLYAPGDAYIVEPDDRGVVSVSAKSNSFKPYLGFGYSGRLVKNRDDWKVSFDCGAMFWGGTPDVYVNDGINLTKDVKNVKGQVGSYVDVFNAFKIFPVLSVRFTKNLF